FEDVAQNELRVGQTARHAAYHHVPAALEFRGARLFEDHSADAEQRRHDGNAETEPAREHAAPDRMCEKRSQREPERHRRDSSSIRPSRMRIKRRAREATAGSCVTTTTAVPSRWRRSSRATI